MHEADVAAANTTSWPAKCVHMNAHGLNIFRFRACDVSDSFINQFLCFTYSHLNAGTAAIERQIDSQYWPRADFFSVWGEDRVIYATVQVVWKYCGRDLLPLEVGTIVDTRNCDSVHIDRVGPAGTRLRLYDGDGMIPCAEVYRLNVSVEIQGHLRYRVITHLFDEVESHLKRAGCLHVGLTCTGTGTLCHLYRRFGFHEVCRISYPQSPEVFHALTREL